jgi:hypothetical protein
MQGQIESLNAAVAGSVALYLAFLSRQKINANSTNEQMTRIN